MAYKINNKTIPIDRGFTHNEIQYPRNWIRLSTQEDKAAIGMVWEDDPVRASDVYYWNGELDNPKALEDVDAVDEDGNPVWEQELDNSDPENPVMVDTDVQVVTHGLKHTMINQVKHTAGTMLAQTDWYVTRKAERNVEVPVDVIDQRTDIRDECDRLESGIAACADVEALIEVMNSQDWSN